MQLINLGIFGLGGGSKLIFSEVECGPMWTVKLIGTIVNPALRTESLREDWIFFFLLIVLSYSMTKLHTFLKSSNVNLKEKTALLHFNPLTTLCLV